MTRKKVLITLGAVGVTFIAIVVVGVSMITNSGAYSEAQTQIRNRQNMANAAPGSSARLAWWRSWSYSESDLEGDAVFSLCADTGRRECYLVRMKKEQGTWRLVSLNERT